MHRGSIVKRGWYCREAEAEAERRTLRFRALSTQIARQYLRRFLNASPGNRNSDAVKNQLTGFGDGGLAYAACGRRDDLLAKLFRDGHLSVPPSQPVPCRRIAPNPSSSKELAAALSQLSRHFFSHPSGAK